ncbi:helix-turn-helix domain-containing protein [Sinomonas atrocyanea]|uniref:helix-turn-helix domain-containing protein n=1 Tax=Sinomonas atrocyanea TaxID=37927 RepID=UPI003D99C7D3
MGIEFGRQLRAQRSARGLTQAQLGANTHSRGLISQIETGEREPTAEDLLELAGRLQLAPDQLQAPDHVPLPEEAAHLLHSMAARQACDLRDWSQAAAHAGQAAAAALAAHRSGAWWDAASLQAECLLRLHRCEESAALARELLAHPLATTEALAARAHDLLARTEKAQGHPGAAVEHARRAVRAAAGVHLPAGLLLEALRTLVEALAEDGRLEEAWEHCGTLADLADDEPEGALQGKAYWTIGNIAFLRRDHATGAAHHRHATTVLSPANDLGLWAQSTKAAAAARITGGSLDAETAVMLKRAEQAYAVIGGTPEDQAELALLRARWLYSTGQPSQALPLLFEAHSARHLLHPRLAADAAQLLARALEAAGRPDEAQRVLEDASHEFAPAGDPRSAGAPANHT